MLSRSRQRTIAQFLPLVSPLGSALVLCLGLIACDGENASPDAAAGGGAPLPGAQLADAGPVDAGASSSTPDAGPRQGVIFVNQADFPQLSNGCVVDSSPSASPLTRGTLDLAFSQRFATAFVVGFNAPGASGAFTRIVLNQTEVQLKDENGQLVAGPTQNVSSGIVEGVAGGAIGYGLVQVTLIAPDYAASLIDALKAGGMRHFTSTIRVSGQSLDGAPVISNAFDLPIDVCFGCLVSFPAAANDPQSAVQPNCEGTSFDSLQPCVLGQNEPVDCRLCNRLLPDSGLCQPPM